MLKQAIREDLCEMICHTLHCPTKLQALCEGNVRGLEVWAIKGAHGVMTSVGIAHNEVSGFHQRALSHSSQQP